MENKKIAVINSVYRIGSTGRICFEMQQYLQDQGYNCRTYYGRNNQKLPDSVYFGNKLDLVLHGIKSRITGKHGMYSKMQTIKLLKQLDDYNPNLYILVNLHGYYLNYKLLLNYLRKKCKQIILIIFDCWLVTGHCSHFVSAKCEKWKEQCCSCALLHAYPKTWLFGNVKKNYKTKKELLTGNNNIYLVCPSNWMKGVLEKSFLKDYKISVINNGIDTGVFKRKAIPHFKMKMHLNEEVLVLCVAYIFTKQKGIYDVLSLSKMLPHNFKLVLVGKVSRKIVLPSNIVHIERTNNVDELIDIYSSCDVFFNPTYEDSYSNVNMEAMSCNLPVICYRTCGAMEMIDKRFVVEQGDVEKVQQLIMQLIAKKVEYDFSNISSFAKKIMYDKYIEIIKRLI